MLNVIANLWGLNNTNTKASPVIKKKKRKNHHNKKNKNNEAKGVDVKSSNNNDDDDENVDDNDVDIVINKNKGSNNDDDYDDLYKADIKDVSYQIIEAVQVLAKKDVRCINKNVSELFSGIINIIID
jgi:hypothetical protein